jgi:hypothetical protein
MYAPAVLAVLGGFDVLVEAKAGFLADAEPEDWAVPRGSACIEVVLVIA